MEGKTSEWFKEAISKFFCYNQLVDRLYGLTKKSACVKVKLYKIDIMKEGITLKKLVALCLLSSLVSTTVLTADAANQNAGGDMPGKESGYEVLRDENGNVYDLGGMEIIIRDWWSSGETYEPTNAYEEAKQEYLDWAMETYNFTIKQIAMGDWNSAPQDFVEYVNADGDEKNYVFTLRTDQVTNQAMIDGLMYDLNELDCLDFTERKFEQNKVHEQYTYRGKIYGMNGTASEPRCGMFFNHRLLTEAGIDPDTIYDMQENGTWTWEAWVDMLKQVQRDTDDDGLIDVWGFDSNYGNSLLAAIYSNGGMLVGMENEKYTYELESPESMEAMEWFADCIVKYGMERPEDASWDYYRAAFKNGECAFMPDEAYMATMPELLDMEDEMGFVMFPKGPDATDYMNCWTNNICVIPNCYDEERAWKIAFAYDIFTDDIPGFNNSYTDAYLNMYDVDERAKNETIPMMLEKGMISYHSVILDLDIGEPLTYRFGKWMSVENVAEIVEDARESFTNCIAEANNLTKDVPATSWQYRYVNKVVDLGIMKGKGDVNGRVVFDPNVSIPREEFVQSLYNASGKPGYTTEASFKDMKKGQWYVGAISWAKESGLTAGVGDGSRFGVGQNITRQDLAVMLYKYASENGYDITYTDGLISEYADSDKVSSYAKKAMNWAITHGVMKGSGKSGESISTYKLNPTATATRAECATMITNFLELKKE